MRNYYELLALSDAELSNVDPVEMNLLVAKSIPSLAGLEISHYQRLADDWAEGVRRRLPGAERVFWKTPQDWKDNVNFFRLGVLCGYLEHEAGIAYKEDQRNVKAIWYTNPSDLFLNGVMDSRRGTCANMAALHVAIGRRLGWPVSLACVGSHFICRYDDGKVTHNIEATKTGRGGFESPTDEEYIRWDGVTPKAVTTGSDLRALNPREMLGVFVGGRARHMRDTNNLIEAEKDYLLARHLFPANHQLYCSAVGAIVLRGAEMFDPQEEGAPLSIAEWIMRRYGSNRQEVGMPTCLPYVIDADPLFSYSFKL